METPNLTGAGLALATLGVIGTECFPPHTGDILYLLRGRKTNNFDDYRISNPPWRTGPTDHAYEVGVSSDLAYGLAGPFNGMCPFFGNGTDVFGFFRPDLSGEGGGQSTFSKLKEIPFEISQDKTAKYVGFELSNLPFLLAIYDHLGKLVYQTSAKGRIKWNYGKVSSGVYFYRLKSGDFSHSGKIIIHD